MKSGLLTFPMLWQKVKVLYKKTDTEADRQDKNLMPANSIARPYKVVRRSLSKI